MSELAEKQRRFAQALLDFRQTEASLSLFKPVSEPEQRLALYRGNLTAIWQKTLTQAYPAVRELVGAEYFEHLARAYGQAYPAQSGNLAEFGEHLPAYLQTLTELLAYPYLTDLAELEWRVHRAYYAAQVPVADLPALARYAQQQQLDLMALQIPVQPFVSLHRSEFAFASIWLALQAPAQTDLAELNWRQPEFAAITRIDWQVKLIQLSQADYAGLIALQQGQGLADACAAALEIAPDFQIATQIQSWFDAGMFGRVD